MNRILTILVSAAAATLISGCAQQVTLSTGEQAQEYLELYMSKAYPGVQPDSWGMYILEDIPGTGDEWTADCAYCNLRSTLRTIGGTIISSTEEAIAKQLDQDDYKPYKYYGPRYQKVDEGSGNAGLQYMLEGMKVGGRRKAVIPAWLLTTSRYSTKEEYIKACSSSTHMIYDITFEGQCQDILGYEVDLLEKYVKEHYGASQESTTYKSDQGGGTFYFISDTTAFKDEDRRSEDASLSLVYTGRRLDGQAFDTNSEKVALKEGLFVTGKAYEDATVKFSDTYSSITMDGSSSLIDGFKGGLYKMHWSGQKATVLFVSDLGYAASGSGDVIPPYSPLIFELELKGDDE